MYEIINKEHLHVKINIYQDDINKIKIGSQFWFYIEQTKFEGKVKLINQNVDQKTKSISLHGDIFDENNFKLKKGAYVIVNIVTDKKLTLAINKNSVINEEDKYFIFVLKDGNFHKIQIYIGMESDDMLEIKEIDQKYADLPVVVQGANSINNILKKDQFSTHAH